MKIKFNLPFNKKNRPSWPRRVGIAIFYTQFILSAFFIYRELVYSCTILSADICPANLDLVVYHYLKLAFLLPIVVLSALFTIIEIISGWDYKFEQEILSVFIFLAWLLFAYINLFVDAPLGAI